MRNDGSPATVAAAEVVATAARMARNHGAPWPPTLMAVNAPTPRNAAWARDSWPVRATSTSRPSAEMAGASTPTMIDSLTLSSVSEYRPIAAIATTPVAGEGDGLGRTLGSQQTEGAYARGSTDH